MTKLIDSLVNWHQDNFYQCLKKEIEGLSTGTLPLCEATVQGGQVDDSKIAVIVLHANDTADVIQADIGVFFNEIVAGCSCGDGPSSENTYCEIRVLIDKSSAEASFSVLTQ